MHGAAGESRAHRWADAGAARPSHLRELSLENKQLKRHQRRTAKRGRRHCACCCGGRCARCADGGAKAFAAWYVFSQNTSSTKQKRVRAARWP